MTIWTVKKTKPVPGAVESLCREFKITPLAAEIALAMGIKNMSEAEYYFNGSIENLHPLCGLAEVKKAFDIIISAINKGLNIVIYGDYDVDGVTSTVILCKALRALGAKVDYFIPDRHTDGYGLNPRAVKDICERGCDLLITCDNGIASKNEIAYTRELGMQTVILDHHEPPFEELDGKRRYILPYADALVDLKLGDVNYPFKDLCAGGLCYKFVRELFVYINKDFVLNDELVVFAALATVCDVVELRDENRIIVRCGLELINSSVDNLGLKRLMEINELTEKQITEYTFGFIIGPCINAGGRLEVAALAAELFMSDNNERCIELAERLYELNTVRKEMTLQGYERLAERADNMNDRILVLYDEDIDESIAGIVAGRLKERYNKPSIVLTKGDGCAKGSGRSIEAYDMFEELSAFKGLFAKFGGHKMAAGMSLPKENIEPLRKALNTACKLTAVDMERELNACKIISMSDVSIYSARDMEIFKPCGNGNPEPLIAAVKLSISGLRFVGAEKNIAQFKLSDDSGNTVSAVCFDGESITALLNGYCGFNAIDEDKNINISFNDVMVDVMATLRVNEYMGNISPKIIVKDMRISK